MRCIDTSIPEVKILEPRLFKDARGYFCETYNRKTLLELGINAEFVQDNESFSQHGVVRGLHYQKGEHAQAKLVRVLQGEVLDVAVDIRAGSPTFGKFVAVRLSGENHLQFFIPKGFAHGFAVLSETALFAYKCDALYAPQAEGSINANDPSIGIDWIVAAEDRLFSDKDLKAQSFGDYLSHPDFIYG